MFGYKRRSLGISLGFFVGAGLAFSGYGRHKIQYGDYGFCQDDAPHYGAAARARATAKAQATTENLNFARRTGVPAS